jgi:hypothetical protein
MLDIDEQGCPARQQGSLLAIPDKQGNDLL